MIMPTKDFIINPFKEQIYLQKNPTSRIPIENKKNIPHILKSIDLKKEHSTNFYKIKKLQEQIVYQIANKVEDEINKILALCFFPYYTDIITYRTQIVPDYYFPKNFGQHYDIQDFTNIKNFLLKTFNDKETIMNMHFFNYLNLACEYAFENIALPILQQPEYFLFDLNSIINVKKTSIFITHQIIETIKNKPISFIFKCFNLPQENQKYKICFERSESKNIHKDAANEIKKMLQNLLETTLEKNEKDIVIVSEKDVFYVDTKRIKNATKTEPDLIKALNLYLNRDIMKMYDKNGYFSFLVIEKTPFKFNYLNIRKYCGVTFNKTLGTICITPENLKQGFKKIENHWIFSNFPYINH